nr:hypothetical protein [Tanacetum cinerariifolium]
MDDSLERVATTATSLDAEQDIGNISKTQSKATPNEHGSQGTSSGGGPRCQEAMGDTVAQTRSERVSKISNDLLVAGVNTPKSREDSLKLTKLMELCTKLQQRVLDLETTKTTQAMQIKSLKRRVKKLEKKQRSISHKHKRLYKVGLSARVESSEDEVSTHDEQMFDADQDLGGEEVFVAQQDKKVVEKEVHATQVQVTTTAKAKGIVFHEPEESTTTTTAALPKPKSQDKEKIRKFFAAKRVEEKWNKPPTQAHKRKIMCTYLKNMEGKKLIDLKNNSFNFIQKMFERAFKMVNIFVDYRTELVEESSKKAKEEVTKGSSKRTGTDLEQERVKKQKIDDDKYTAERKQLVNIIPDEEGVAIDAIPLAVKPPSIVNQKIQKERKKSYYKIIRVGGSSKIYLIFSHMLKVFDRKDVETLWKLVKAKYGSTRPEEDYERVLWGDLKSCLNHILKMKYGKCSKDIML